MTRDNTRADERHTGPHCWIRCLPGLIAVGVAAAWWTLDSTLTPATTAIPIGRIISSSILGIASFALASSHARRLRRSFPTFPLMLDVEMFLGFLRNATPVCVIVLDDNDKVVFSHAGHSSLGDIAALNAMPADLLDLGIQILDQSGQTVPYEQTPYRIAQRTGQQVDGMPLAILREDGSLTYVLATAVPMKSCYGKRLHCILILEETTEQVKVAMALKESEQRFRAVLEGVDLVAIMLDRQGRLTFCNDHLTGMTGYSRDEIIGVDWFKHFIQPEDRSDLLEIFLQSTGGEDPVLASENDIVTASGERRRISWSNTIMRDELGNVTGIACLGADITESLRVQQVIKESEGKYRALFEQAADSIIVVDPITGQIIDFNERALETLGYTRTEFGHMRLADFEIEPSAVSAFQTQGAIAQGENQYDTEFRTSDDKIRQMLVTTREITISGHLLLQMIVRDVTDLKRTQAAFRESEERYRQLFNAGSDLAFVQKVGPNGDPLGHFIEVNDNACMRLGYTREVLLTMNPVRIVAPSRLLRLRRIAKTLARRDRALFESAMITHDGQEIPVEVHTHRFHLQGERYALSVARDITRRIQVEEEHARLFAAIQQSEEVVIIFDTVGRIVFCNPAFEKVTGFPMREANGRPLGILGLRNEEDGRPLSLCDVRISGTWSGRLTGNARNGSEFSEEGTVSPIRDGSGEIVNYVKVTRDITRQLEIEDQLRQAQKMEAIGRLAGGIAHDFNNTLSLISGYAELLQMDMMYDDPLLKHVNEIADASSRAAQLTQGLLAFSRKSAIQPQVLNLNGVLTRIAGLVRRLIGEDIALEMKAQDHLWNVRADPTQIEQIMLNLATNARDAMSGGGTLVIETDNAVLGSSDLPQETEVKPGKHVCIRLTDDGTGMDAATRERVFEPFFSTKGTAGTGLGLATVYGIVRQHDGHIECHSTPGEGTVFSIYLPAVDEPEDPQPVELPEQAHGRGGRETILFVEDEEGVLAVSAQILERKRYTVLKAHDGETARKIVRDHDGPIELLLTDVILPDTNGRELADELTAMRPDMRVLYTSGYADDVIARHGITRTDMEFISKPHRLIDLVRKVREVLGK
jgi:two-component system, cell cycle sensor histidine kinase and response regulator CckA